MGVGTGAVAEGQRETLEQELALTGKALEELGGIVGEIMDALALAPQTSDGNVPEAKSPAVLSTVDQLDRHARALVGMVHGLAAHLARVRNEVQRLR